MGRIRCPETSVNNYHMTPRNIPEKRRSYHKLFHHISFLMYFIGLGMQEVFLNQICSVAKHTLGNSVTNNTLIIYFRLGTHSSSRK
jgi:hypothetical protein